MMLIQPKGHKWWCYDENGENSIKEEAPEWAKKEFEEYQELMSKSGKPDENGMIIDY